ncbi:MAG: hypothetical protein SFU83_19735 [Meiothermus sp.]|nr:hypothetical protein [Meiothermus sp.]
MRNPFPLLIVLLAGLLAACGTGGTAPTDCKCRGSASLTLSDFANGYNGSQRPFSTANAITLSGNLAVQSEYTEDNKVRRVNVAILSPVAGQTYAVKRGTQSNGATVGYRDENRLWTAADGAGSVRVDAVNQADGTFTYTLINVVVSTDSTAEGGPRGSVNLNGTLSVVKTP